jgi:hypothetical protein
MFSWLMGFAIGVLVGYLGNMVISKWLASKSPVLAAAANTIQKTV